jgi:hypothetical protein
MNTKFSWTYHPFVPSIAVIYFTVFLMGITIRPLLYLLKVEKADLDYEAMMVEKVYNKYFGEFAKYFGCCLFFKIFRLHNDRHRGHHWPAGPSPPSRRFRATERQTVEADSDAKCEEEGLRCHRHCARLQQDHRENCLASLLQ